MLGYSFIFTTAMVVLPMAMIFLQMTCAVPLCSDGGGGDALPGEIDQGPSPGCAVTPPPAPPPPTTPPVVTAEQTPKVAACCGCFTAFGACIQTQASTCTRFKGVSGDPRKCSQGSWECLYEEGAELCGYGSNH